MKNEAKKQKSARRAVRLWCRSATSKRKEKGELDGWDLRPQ